MLHQHIFVVCVFLFLQLILVPSSSSSIIVFAQQHQQEEHAGITTTTDRPARSPGEDTSITIGFILLLASSPFIFALLIGCLFCADFTWVRNCRLSLHNYCKEDCNNFCDENCCCVKCFSFEIVIVSKREYDREDRPELEEALLRKEEHEERRRRRVYSAPSHDPTTRTATIDASETREEPSRDTNPLVVAQNLRREAVGDRYHLHNFTSELDGGDDSNSQQQEVQNSEPMVLMVHEGREIVCPRRNDHDEEFLVPGQLPFGTVV